MINHASTRIKTNNILRRIEATFRKALNDAPEFGSVSLTLTIRENAVVRLTVETVQSSLVEPTEEEGTFSLN
jgi:hypothetical protein